MGSVIPAFEAGKWKRGSVCRVREQCRSGLGSRTLYRELGAGIGTAGSAISEPGSGISGLWYPEPGVGDLGSGIWDPRSGGCCPGQNIGELGPVTRDQEPVIWGLGSGIGDLRFGGWDLGSGISGPGGPRFPDVASKLRHPVPRLCDIGSESRAMGGRICGLRSAIMDPGSGS